MSHNTEKTALKTAVMGDSSQPLLQAGTVLLSARVGENKPPPPSSPEPNRTKRKKEIQSVEPCIPQWAFRRPICFVFFVVFFKTVNSVIIYIYSPTPASHLTWKEIENFPGWFSCARPNKLIILHQNSELADCIFSSDSRENSLELKKGRS